MRTAIIKKAVIVIRCYDVGMSMLTTLVVLHSPSEVKRHHWRVPGVALSEGLPKRGRAGLGNGLKCETEKTRYRIVQQTF